MPAAVADAGKVLLYNVGKVRVLLNFHLFVKLYFNKEAVSHVGSLPVLTGFISPFFHPSILFFCLYSFFPIQAFLQFLGFLSF